MTVTFTVELSKDQERLVEILAAVDGISYERVLQKTLQAGLDMMLEQEDFLTAELLERGGPLN